MHGAYNVYSIFSTTLVRNISRTDYVRVMLQIGLHVPTISIEIQMKVECTDRF
jgi:hypothetical protein